MPKLTREQHNELAFLLAQAADNIKEAAKIVSRAAFSDRALYVGGTLQEWLIDPLSEELEGSDNPYQSIGYGGPHRRKPAPIKQCVPK